MRMEDFSEVIFSPRVVWLLGGEMSGLDSIPTAEVILRRLIEEENYCLLEASNLMKKKFPQVTRGLSPRSIRRYCRDRGIHRTGRLADEVVDKLVKISIHKVGPTYGRKTLTGLLRSNGFKIAEKRIGSSLKKVHPIYSHQRMTRTQAMINPVPYSAKYCGEKVHIDQNEKLVQFGVTHVCAVDGFSGMIVGFVTMPVKNNKIIYEELYMKMLSVYGMWEQIRVDFGKEWYLMLSVQASLAHLRSQASKAPYVQTTSKKNHIVERMWCEVNTRINYPIKAILVDLLDKGLISTDNPLHLFCISWLSTRVAFVGVELFSQSWNNHPIPGRRKGTMPSHIPYHVMKRDNRATVVDAGLIPHPQEAADRYRLNGGRITDPGNDNQDPLYNDSLKSDIRFQSFTKRFPSMDDIFHNVVNGNSSSFVDALNFFIDLTFRLSVS